MHSGQVNLDVRKIPRLPESKRVKELLYHELNFGLAEFYFLASLRVDSDLVPFSVLSNAEISGGPVKHLVLAQSLCLIFAVGFFVQRKLDGQIFNAFALRRNHLCRVFQDFIKPLPNLGHEHLPKGRQLIQS